MSVADRSQSSLARIIDVSAVQAYHAEDDVHGLAGAARTYGFGAAHVLPHWAPLLARLLAGSRTRVGAPVGFPSGGVTTATKVAEAQELVRAGTHELDVVANLGLLRSGRGNDVVSDLRAVLEATPEEVPIRVILETSVLSDYEIRRGAEMVVASGATCIKTGTGWAGPTTPVAVSAIREAIGEAVTLKVAGGVRSLEQVRAMRALGVTRFGVSLQAAVRLVEEELRTQPTGSA